jgi:homoserine O-succinyltransferase
MPLVASSKLPTFEYLKREGENVVSHDAAVRQDIREMHVGLLNMMPDAALAATERQFFRLIGQSNQIAQFYVHPFTFKELRRSKEAEDYVAQYYETFDAIKEQGLDALIVTGATPPQTDLSLEPFWKPLIQVIDWAYDNVTSTLCSCLATHAVLQFRYGQKRRHQGFKRWGVYSHRVVDRRHPLVADVNTRFDVPHSRFFDVSREQFEAAGLHILVESDVAGVHLAVSDDQFRLVFNQGHPEYDMVSLLKEYKREVIHFARGERTDYPPLVENYFPLKIQAILEEHQERAITARLGGQPVPDLPESLIAPALDNTWHDTAESVIDNWVGKVYQLTSMDRKKPFTEGVDPRNPLGLLTTEKKS